jgi:hypothetical protein
MTCLALKPWESVFDKFGPLMFKAVIKAEIAEFNRTRQWDNALKAAVAASTSLTDLKARVALLPNRPAVTASNAYDEVSGYIVEWENE